ncbi:MAG: site-specific integrase [Bacteroidia bacterium]|nr:site-specific integrase [Bacteroidia bacterium]
MEILLRLDTRKPRKDGTYPIILRLSGNNKTLPIPTGYAVPERYWHKTECQVKKGYNAYGAVNRLNNILTDMRNRGRSVITKLQEDESIGGLAIHDVKARIVSLFRKKEAEAIIFKLRETKVIASDRRMNEILALLDDMVQNGALAQISQRDLTSYFSKQVEAGSVFQFIKDKVRDLRDLNKTGNADVYETLHDVLKNYWGSERNLKFNQIDLKFVEGFEKWHMKKMNALYDEGKRKRKPTLNGVGNYLRTLRATYKSAIKAGLADKDANPFDEYTIKTEPTDKRAISEESLKAIISLELEPSDKLYLTRNFFLASFAMQGMSFSDMAHLKIENINDGRIKYRRTKTSRIYNIKVTEFLLQILNVYTADKSDKDYVFPIIKRQSAEDQYRDIRWARKRYNDNLKEIAVLCEIKDHLTSYVSRHSFAMLARLSKVPIEVISQMLGHKTVKTTEIYLDSLPDAIVDDYADQVMDFTKK